jgi:predicted AAA+ superfamily ATPase
MTYFSRVTSNYCKHLAATFPAVVVTGARQSGKTTLLRNTFPNHTYVTLDLPSVAEMADRDGTAFLRNYPGDLLIDEVQYAPGLFRYLKAEIDADRTRMGRFLLTGSQKFTLMQAVSDSLAGRAAVLSLETLSLRELPADHGKNEIAMLARGMFPELWRAPDLDTHAFYSSYVSTYIERDVRQVVNIGSLRDFERFLRACAVRSGQILNVSNLARDVGVTPKTAQSWLSALEATNQVYLLEPYFENVGKRMVKSPKLYLNDTGMLCFLLGLTESNLVNTPLIGMIWETFVCAELRKRHSHSDKPLSLWFYRDGQGREVDFLEMGEGKLNLYEAKWAEDPDDRWFRILHEIAGYLAKGVMATGDLSIVCRTPVTLRKDGVILQRPESIGEERARPAGQ